MEDQVPSSKQYVTPGQLPEENNYFSDPAGPRYQNPAEYQAAMNAQNAQPQQPGVVYNTPDPAQPPVPDFQEMRRIALEQAIQQVTQHSAPAQAPPSSVPQAQVQYPTPQEPNIVYVRRNLTLAEILVIFAVSCGLVFGVQGAWNFATDILPRIEIREN